MQEIDRKKRSNPKVILTAGFAMFAMFFGSGNLVFPLALGTQALDQSLWATWGLLLTAVLMPFLGIITITLHRGDRLAFFQSIGKVPALLLTLVMLSLMGPFGVAARCLLVAYGGVELLVPGLSIDLFSILFCVVTFFMVWNYHRIVPIIGRVLTPWLIVGIVALSIAGIIKSPEVPAGAMTAGPAFFKGLKQGYQIMDLLAAFFFSATTIQYLQLHVSKKERPSTLIKLSLASSCLGAGLLAIVYIGFVFLGSAYAEKLALVNPESSLVAIAHYTLGPAAVPIVSITILLACLTTTAILVSLFADFLNQELSGKFLGRHPSIAITLGITYATSRLGFSKMASVLGTILDVAYPALIALAVANIIEVLTGKRLSKPIFWLALGLSSGAIFL